MLVGRVGTAVALLRGMNSATQNKETTMKTLEQLKLEMAVNVRKCDDAIDMLGELASELREIANPENNSTDGE